MRWDAQSFDKLASVRNLNIMVPAPGRDAIRTPIWIVSVGGQAVCAVVEGRRGPVVPARARRYGVGTVTTRHGELDMRFVPATDPTLDAAIDEAYLAKYGDNSSSRAMIQPPATGTTLRLESAS